MKLLVITQKVDQADSNLGFFHHWLEVWSRSAELIVIANEVGEVNLPARVKVISLGKEKGRGRLWRYWRYQFLFLRFIFQVDGIFFHMCPEYVLAAGLYPKLFQRKTILWYTHQSVNWRLRIAEKLVDRVCTASAESFRLPSKKVLMTGHGVDMEWFHPVLDAWVEGIKLLAVGRIAPVKDLETIILAVDELKKKNLFLVHLDIIGSPYLEKDYDYYVRLKRLVADLHLEKEIQFLGAKSYSELPRVYQSHNIFLHTSQTGSVDKVVLEALACGLAVFTSSNAYDNLSALVSRFTQGDAQDLAKKIAGQFPNGRVPLNETGAHFIQENFSLERLLKKVTTYYASEN